MAQTSWVPTGLWDLDGPDVLVWKPDASSEILAGPLVVFPQLGLLAGSKPKRSGCLVWPKACSAKTRGVAQLELTQVDQVDA